MLLLLVIITSFMQQSKEPFNQRASHFILGTQGQSYGSSYDKFYPAKTANYSCDGKRTEVRQGNNINPTNQGNFATTNNAMLKDWGQIPKAALDPSKLNELKGHHFKLGSYHPDQAYTSNNYFHNRKEISSDAVKNREEGKNKMRAHYHDFKEQNYTNFQSTYNKQFLGKDGQPAERIMAENTENAIVFGNHHLAKVTTNNADFVKKIPDPKEVKNSFQQTSALVLGDKPEEMKTINQQYFDEKPITKNQLPESTIKELRNTHFNLGGMPINYSTEVNQNFYNMGNKNKYEPPKIDYQSGSWMPENAVFNSSTTSKRELPARPVKTFSKAEPTVKGGFSLGGHHNSYQTETSQRFLEKQSNYQGAVRGPEIESLKMGDDKGRYQTEHKQNFIDRNLNQAKCKVDIAALSKEDHFQIGGQGQDAKLTVYQDQFRSDQQNKSKLFHKQNQ